MHYGFEVPEGGDAGRAAPSAGPPAAPAVEGEPAPPSAEPEPEARAAEPEPEARAAEPSPPAPEPAPVVELPEAVAEEPPAPARPDASATPPMLAPTLAPVGGNLRGILRWLGADTD